MMNDVEAFCIMAADLSHRKRTQEALEAALTTSRRESPDEPVMFENEIADRERAKDALRETEARIDFKSL